MKKRFFYSHPIIGGIIAALLAYIACYAISLVVVGITHAIMPDAGEEFFHTLTNASFAVVSLIYLPIFWILNKKNAIVAPSRYMHLASRMCGPSLPSLQ